MLKKEPASFFVWLVVFLVRNELRRQGLAGSSDFLPLLREKDIALAVHPLYPPRSRVQQCKLVESTVKQFTENIFIFKEA